MFWVVYSGSCPQKAREYPRPHGLHDNNCQSEPKVQVVIYDQNFRLEVAGQVWAKVDPSIYAQCFTGQSVSPENWCSQCQGLDHATARGPFKPAKRVWSNTGGQTPSGSQAPTRMYQPTSAGMQACFKYNQYNGDCKYGRNGRKCRYPHVCSSCGGPHPA